MYGRACFAGMICLLASVAAAAPPEDRATIQLWNDKAPGALGDKPEDTPLVQVFIPPQPSVASIVVWLGSPLSRHVTGRCFEARGGELSLADGWRSGAVIDKGARWEPAELSLVVDRLISEAAAPQKVYGT